MLKETGDTEFSLLKIKDFIKFYYFKRTLIFGMRNPSRVEKNAFKSGDLIFKLFPQPNVLFLVFKFGDLDWSDIAYSFHLDFIRKDENFMEYLLKSYPKEFNLVLFDVFTGKVKITRKFSFNNEFARNLRDKILSQCEKPFNLDKYKAEVKQIYNNYFSSHLALNKKVSSSCRISGAWHKDFKEILYERYGFGTNNSIPKWIYKEIHNPKINGLITKEQIPEEVLRLGVVKGTYKKVKNRYWTVELYKKKKIKKNRKN